MKLLRYGPKGKEKPGLLDENGRIRDLSGHVNDITPELLASDRLTMLSSLDPKTLPEVGGKPRLGMPVMGVGKIVAIGLNYNCHAKEVGAEPPTEPRLFCKAITALNGPNDPVLEPRGAEKLDWEVELAVIIGARAQCVKEADAMKHVAGYAVMDDVSERAWQLERGGQWFKGKSFDSFAPLGPWLVTKDEIKDPHNLNLWLEVNGQRRQNSNTSQMTFKITFLVSYISEFMTLMPGDIITTGTPSGSGAGMNPPAFLKVGDVIRLGVEGLGEQRHVVKAWEEQGV